MKRTLLLLLIYFCLTLTVGKQVRVFYFQLLTEKNFAAKAQIPDLAQGEAESEESDSDDTEESGLTDDDKEIAAQLFLVALKGPSFSNYSATPFFKDYLKEINSPPPRF